MASAAAAAATKKKQDAAQKKQAALRQKAVADAAAAAMKKKQDAAMKKKQDAARKEMASAAAAAAMKKKQDAAAATKERPARLPLMGSDQTKEVMAALSRQRVAAKQQPEGKKIATAATEVRAYMQLPEVKPTNAKLVISEGMQPNTLIIGNKAGNVLIIKKDDRANYPNLPPV